MGGRALLDELDDVVEARMLAGGEPHEALWLPVVRAS